MKQVDCRERELEFVMEGPRGLAEELPDKLLTVLDDDELTLSEPPKHSVRTAHFSGQWSRRQDRFRF